MSQTPDSASRAFVTVPIFFQYYAPQLAANMLRATPNAPNPSYLAMMDSTNPAGQKLRSFLGRAAGEIEAACGIAKRYRREDLEALTGVSRDLLNGLNSARGMWLIFQRLKPGAARLDECPGAAEAMQMLQDLRDGQLIFSFVEAQDAGLPSVKQADPSKLLTPNVVRKAYRLFPSYGSNSLNGGE